MQKIKMDAQTRNSISANAEKKIGHVVQIKLETGVNFRFVSLLP